jgi:hypothetical protein
MLLRVDHGHRKFRNRLECSYVAVTRAAPQLAMPASCGMNQRAGSISARFDLANLRRPATGARGESSSQQAVEEINAYITVRDVLLVEAEEVTTRGRLDRLTIANEFVETCLRPARSPYEAQCLAETDAIRKRKRCASVKVRIAELRLVVV